MKTGFAEQIPDSFFTPTAADLKAAQATLSARTHALVNAPLQLRAAREAEEKVKRDRWPNVRPSEFGDVFCSDGPSVADDHSDQVL